jgi:hypothetical protein
MGTELYQTPDALGTIIFKPPRFEQHALKDATLLEDPQQRAPCQAQLILFSLDV